MHTRDGALFISPSCCGVSVRRASLRPSSDAASPSVRTSTRGGTLQWTSTVVAGPTNLQRYRAKQGYSIVQGILFTVLRAVVVLVVLVLLVVVVVVVVCE